MKKFFLMLLCGMLLVGCGNDQNIGNLYQSGNVETSQFEDIEYKIPEIWVTDSNSSGHVRNYTDDGLLISAQEADTEWFSFEFILNDEDFLDEFIDGLKDGMEWFQEKERTKIELDGLTAYRIQADINFNGATNLDMAIIVFDFHLYTFTMFTDEDSESEYSDEFESLLSSIEVIE